VAERALPNADSVDARVDFRSVVCGIDASPQSAVAVRQTIALAAEGARLAGVAAWDPGLAIHAGTQAAEVLASLREEAAGALAGTHAAFPDLEPLLVRGAPVAVLLATIANHEADLVSVGSHGGSRAAGVLFGSVATAMAHHAPCSVLVAREAEAGRFPDVIVHANDGSPESLDAALVAGRIAARHDASVVTVHVADTPGEGGGVAEGSVRLIEATGREPLMRVVHGSPHRSIVQVANDASASLIVMGSRGRTGLAALGSVSERVTHHASCSVLVVRRLSHPVRDADDDDR
jgi:nucleotide-binding universal stress UspA family protein